MNPNDPGTADTAEHGPQDGRPDIPTRPLVLFDGACSLCKREIAHYRRTNGADGVEWVDLSRFAPGQDVHGIDHAAAMAAFHVRDAQGHWHRGAHAFVELWHHLGPYRALGKLVRHSGLTPVLSRAYAYFARWRLRRRCQDASCTVATGGRDSRAPSHGHTGDTAPLGDTRCE